MRDEAEDAAARAPALAIFFKPGVDKVEKKVETTP